MIQGKACDDDNDDDDDGDDNDYDDYFGLKLWKAPDGHWEDNSRIVLGGDAV